MSNLTDVNWDEIPAPVDDGRADHLPGKKLPDVSLRATDKSMVRLSELSGRVVIYAYPMTGRPGTDLPVGWDDLPGARGCTPQSCAFRDHAAELRELGIDAVYGLSTQTTEYQQEAATRLQLPFLLLSDQSLDFAKAMSLPTFTVEGSILLCRLTMIVNDGQVDKVFYPVFPPDSNAQQVIDFIKS